MRVLLMAAALVASAIAGAGLGFLIDLIRGDDVQETATPPP